MNGFSSPSSYSFSKIATLVLLLLKNVSIWPSDKKKLSVWLSLEARYYRVEIQD